MSLNFAFGFSLFLLLLVILNVYFFYTLNTTVGSKRSYFNLPNVKTDQLPGVYKDIYDYLNYLPNKYKNKHYNNFKPLEKELVNYFNKSKAHLRDIWAHADNWMSEDSLFPYKDGASGQILQAIQQTPIALVDNAPKGTQLKLLLLLEDKKKLYFKPKRYELHDVIRGDIYAGFDRHNSEVFAYYLAMALNFTWVAPAAIRRIHIERDLVPVATDGLKRTMSKNGSGSLCIYGKCFYCKANETVCANSKGELEGAAILYLDKPFKVFRYPWRRSYKAIKMEWEKDNDFCKKVILTMSTKRLLNLIDVAIFDFLLQNGDRHDYEMYKNKVVLLDNGKGLGNPSYDELDILAPLYQCCIVRASTWQHLESISGGTLTEVIRVVASFQGDKLATDDHFRAIERRLLKIYATVQYCIGKKGSYKVLKTGL